MGIRNVLFELSVYSGNRLPRSKRSELKAFLELAESLPLSGFSRFSAPHLLAHAES